MPFVNETAYLVQHYLEKKTLADLGYTFSGENMDMIEYKIMTFIGNEFIKLSNADMRKPRSR